MTTKTKEWKKLKKVKNSKKINNDAIILSYSWVCWVIASFPIPFWDVFVIVPIQILMWKTIANNYWIEITKQQSKDIVLQILWTIWMWFLAQQLIIRVVYKFIPYLGTITTIPVVFAFSYAIWKVMDTYFYYKTLWKEISKDEIKNIFHWVFEDMKQKAKKLWSNKIKSYWDDLKNDNEIQEELWKFKK